MTRYAHAHFFFNNSDQLRKGSLFWSRLKLLTKPRGTGARTTQWAVKPFLSASTYCYLYSKSITAGISSWVIKRPSTQIYSFLEEFWHTLCVRFLRFLRWFYKTVLRRLCFTHLHLKSKRVLLLNKVCANFWSYALFTTVF